MKNMLKNASAACLAAGLVSTWDTPAAAQTFSGAITPTQDLTALYFFYSTGICIPAYSKKITDFVAVGTTYNFSFTMQSIPTNVFSPTGYFTVAALYGDPANGNVSLGFNPDAAASAISQSLTWGNGWGDGFIGTMFVGGSEAQMAGDLQTGTNGVAGMDDALFSGPIIDQFFGIYSPTLSPGATDFTLVDFSGASAGGSGFVEVVPEPGATCLLAAGTGLFSFRLLRRPVPRKD